MPSVLMLWHCWLGSRKGIRSVKNWVVGCWCGYRSGVRCKLDGWCHCYSLSLASVKSRLVLPFWYRLTWAVLDKGPLNRCVCVWWFQVCLRVVPLCVLVFNKPLRIAPIYMPSDQKMSIQKHACSQYTCARRACTCTHPHIQQCRLSLSFWEWCFETLYFLLALFSFRVLQQCGLLFSSLSQSVSQSTWNFFWHCYTTRPGELTVVSGKHDQKVHSWVVFWMYRCQ